MVLLLAFPPGGLIWADEAVVSLATDAASYHFEMRDGVPTGFFAVLLEQAIAATGRRVDFHVRPWARCLEEAKAGLVDGFFAAYRRPEREPYYLYSQTPLYFVQEHIYVRKGEGFDSRQWQERLRGKRVGVLNGSYHGQTYQDALARTLFATIELGNTTESLVAMLSAGRIDAIFTTSDLMDRALDDMGQAGAIDRTEPAIEALPVYLAFTRKRDLTALRDEVDRELVKMKEDGRYDALLHRFQH
jgi:polar amino acid transport system substrate-binding protein